MKNKLIYILAALLAVLFILNAAAADYSFRVPSADIYVMLEPDGSMSISVEYTFENLGQKLDYIDIGLPNNNYTLGEIQVWLNGTENSAIKVTKADYSQSGLRYGITLEMRDASIPGGGSGTVEVLIPNLRRNMYDASSETYGEEEVEFVGFEFSPNYFGKKYVKGTTDYSFTIGFPAGVPADRVYYYTPKNWPGNEEPDAWITEEGRVVYNWVYNSANAYSEYTFGGKFPKNILTSTANIVAPSSGGGGSSSSDDAWWEPVLGVLICVVPTFGFIFFIVRKIINSVNGTSKTSGSPALRSYLPPEIKSDGEGIKRGLTAVEAAILLEVDLERVISMILYGLSKKEVIEVISEDPLEVKVVDPLPDTLYEYERNFIDALQKPSLTEKRKGMRETMHRLILSVTKKMEGFSVKETREYYQSICDKAWAQVEAAETAEMKSKLLGDNFGWAMLEEEPEKKIEETFTAYDMLPPTWWWRVDPGYRRSPPTVMPSSGSSESSGSSSGGSSKRSSGSSTSSSKPSMMPVLPGAMFARSITNAARNLGTSTVGNMTQFKSSVKNRTNPAPVRTSSRGSSGGGSSSGGSSCACACACASCACACAGGGR
ncbi:MAG: hypothetical protein IJI07_07745 [Flexilinea sp.]|nr:hypothetical protein [Flexilinea sp.]